MHKFKNDIYPNLRVLARSSPEDKLLLVTGFQACDGVVAVTGDGTNDAPALTKADVGFSMGITGTDVAKGASDIILLDDNFSSIVVALRYGRSVYDNVRKFIQFQLSVNVVAMFIVFFGSVILRDSPLNAVQMLWVNLVMDTLGALALATEPPAVDILERQPYRKDNPIVTGVMWRNVFGHAIWQIFILLIILFEGPGWLCEAYGTKCLKFDATDATECISYNPYYSNGLYYKQPALDDWTSLNLTKSDFDTDMINQMICDNYKKNENHTTTSDFVCDSSIYDNPANLFLPQDIELDTGSQKLMHFTIVFQVFVMLQVFNQINARKIEDGQLNVFKDFFNNPMFIVIMVITVTIQLIMVEIGGVVTKCAPLNTHQNLYSILVGSSSLFWGLVIKFIPLKFFQCISIDEKPMNPEEAEQTLSNKFKRSSTIKHSASCKEKCEHSNPINN